MNQLKPCPFCNGTNINIIGPCDICFVQCEDCGATFPHFDTKQQAITAWNSRAPHWIPVSERLPEQAGQYLVAYRPCYWDKVYPGVRVGQDSFRGKSSWAQKKYQLVTHWMPLPQPPESI